MKLPALDDLVGKQWSVYDHPPDESLFVAGPPGSGKTSLAVLRARFLAGPPLAKSVALVTRNRMLAALAQELGNAEFKATTMNSLVSKDYAPRFRRYVPQFREYSPAIVYDWDAILNDYEQEEVEPLYDHMVVDEGQNLPVGFFHWASRYGARTLTIFADEDQATDAQHSSLSEISNATGLVEIVRLTDNHRNTPEIAEVAEHFHESKILPPAIVQRPAGGEVPQLLRVGSLDELTQRVATRYRNRGESIGVIVPLKKDAYDLYSSIKKRLPIERVDVYTSDNAQGTEADIRLLDPGITALTGESVIGLEFDAVFLLDLRRSLPCTSAEDHRRMYMLCARARDALLLIDWPPYLTGRQLAALPAPPVLVR